MALNTVTPANADEVARTVKGGAVVGPATVRRSPGIAALAQAMLLAQQEMENPARTSDNAYFESKYADLAEVREAVLSPLLKNGLVVMQLPCHLDGSPALQTLLVHAESGEWLETTIGLHAGKTTPQAIGSAITYARRYALQAIAGVAAEDDDGNEASRPAAPAPGRQQNPPQPAPPTAEQVQAEVASWREWLASDPDLDGFNETLKADLGGLSKEVKAPVWEMVRKYASEHKWSLDQGLKRFVEKPQEKPQEKAKAS